MLSSFNLYIILVEPQLGENIGAAARSMSNFGYSGLRIVNPRDGWPNLKALDMSAHGSFVLEKAAIYDSLKESVADLNYVAATSASSRLLNKPQIHPADIAKRLSAISTKVSAGILFGRERSGLTNEEISIADDIITIPTSDANASLNLAQAVAIIVYELSKHTLMLKHSTSYEKATQNEVEYLIQHLDLALNQKDFFKVAAKRKMMMNSIRNMLMRMQPSSQEVSTMRGMIKALTHHSKLS